MTSLYDTGFLAHSIREARHAASLTLMPVKTASGTVRSRINIENTRQLKDAGFHAGTRFSVRYNPGLVEIQKDEHAGTNTIAPKRFPRRDGSSTSGERLDLRSLQIQEHFAGAEQVLALYLSDRILVLHLPTVVRAQERTRRLL